MLALAAAGNATPLACSHDCEIVGAEAAFLPAAFEIKSGSPLVWTSRDIYHSNADGVKGSDEPCFFVEYTAGQPSSPVRFDITASGLEATVDGVTLACANGSALPGGAYALPYYCIVHGHMRGALLVSP